jgi:hypothetical protein
MSVWLTAALSMCIQQPHFSTFPENIILTNNTVEKITALRNA